MEFLVFKFIVGQYKWPYVIVDLEEFSLILDSLQIGAYNQRAQSPRTSQKSWWRRMATMENKFQGKKRLFLKAGIGVKGVVAKTQRQITSPRNSEAHREKTSC
jgi:hypothetical protein